MLSCFRTGPTPNKMLEALEKLCRHAAQVFPLKYQSDVELLGGPHLGCYSGIWFIENKQRMFIGPDGTTHLLCELCPQPANQCCTAVGAAASVAGAVLGGALSLICHISRCGRRGIAWRYGKVKSTPGSHQRSLTQIRTERSCCP